MDYKTISFYRYTEIEEPEKLRKLIRAKCEELGVLGRMLLGEEGINAAACGRKEQIAQFEAFINEHFPKMFFKEQDVPEQVYRKLVVRTRREIVAFGQEVNIAHKAPYMEPEELHNLLANGEEVMIIDARNDYEYETGRFKDAHELNIKRFRDFAKEVEKIKNHKGKKIVTYCTGGIRCEKASAYLKEQGFEDVHQLHGGIIHYVDKYPKGFFEGACYVFDSRQTFNDSGKVISYCGICEEPSDIFMNCHNLDCDKLFICCPSCQEKMQKCCSQACIDAPRHRQPKERFKVLGKITKYFRKPNVAEVAVAEPFFLNEEVNIKGKTSDFSLTIKELRDYDQHSITQAKEGMIVSFPVTERVRENDLVRVKI